MQVYILEKKHIIIHNNYKEDEFMDKVMEYYIDFNEKVEKMLRKSQYLGCGHNGIVFMLPDNKIIKIFMEPKVCDEEYYILKRVIGSKYFPKVYEKGEYYIIRDYVGGKRLDEYLKNHYINTKTCKNIIKLIKEFERLKFTKLDIRCKDIYIQKDFSLIIIDPKNNYSKSVEYPRHLMKGLNKAGVLEKFLSVVKDEEPELYSLWNFRMKQYMEKNIK